MKIHELFESTQPNSDQDQLVIFCPGNGTEYIIIDDIPSSISKDQFYNLCNKSGLPEESYKGYEGSLEYDDGPYGPDFSRVDYQEMIDHMKDSRLARSDYPVNHQNLKWREFVALVNKLYNSSDFEQ